MARFIPEELVCNCEFALTVLYPSTWMDLEGGALRCPCELHIGIFVSPRRKEDLFKHSGPQDNQINIFFKFIQSRGLVQAKLDRLAKSHHLFCLSVLAMTFYVYLKKTLWAVGLQIYKRNWSTGVDIYVLQYKTVIV